MLFIYEDYFSYFRKQVNMGDEAESGRLKRTRHVSSKMAQFLQETVKRKSGVSRYMGDSGEGDDQIDNTVIVVNQFPENHADDKKGKRKIKNGKRGRSKEAKEDNADPVAVEPKKRSSQEITDELIDAINEELQKGRSKKAKEDEEDGEKRRRSKNKSPNVGRRAQVLDITMEEDNESSLSHSRPGSSTDEDTLIQLSKRPVEKRIKFPKNSITEDQVEAPKTSETQSRPRYYNGNLTHSLRALTQTNNHGLDVHNTSRSVESQKMKVVRPLVRHPFIPAKFQTSRKSDSVSQVPFQKIPKVVVPVQPRPDSVSDQENRIQSANTSEAQPTPRYYNGRCRVGDSE